MTSPGAAAPVTGPHVAVWADLNPQTLHDVLRLRVDVFVVEQSCPYPELDGRDPEPGTEHVWFAAPDGVAAYLRVLAEPDGSRRVGRVVTRADSRGRRLADALLADVVRRHGDRVLCLDAQTYVAGFYARHGFVVSGEQFLEDGIEHVPMRRDPGVPTGSGCESEATTTG